MAFQKPAFDQKADADTGVRSFVEIFAGLSAEHDPRGVEDGPRSRRVPLDAGVDLAQRGEVHGIAPGQAGLRGAVRGGVEENAARGLAVAAGATRLLGIGLQRRAGAEVDDEADVGLVDAHTKGNGGDDDARVAAHEAILVGGAQPGLEARVIWHCPHTIIAEDAGQILCIATG